MRLGSDADVDMVRMSGQAPAGALRFAASACGREACQRVAAAAVRRLGGREKGLVDVAHNLLKVFSFIPSLSLPLGLALLLLLCSVARWRCE
jgi:hypothetical protein